MTVISCVVPVAGPARLLDFNGDVEMIHAAVTPWLLDRTPMDRQVHAWIGDMSLSDGSPVNPRVTDERDRLFLADGREPIRYPICGTVLLIASDTLTQSSIDLPERWLTDLAPGGRLSWLE